jgi:tRNA threonylcarbamoyladenosine modification (KEOPS) complex  Pcc1 subunit
MNYSLELSTEYSKELKSLFDSFQESYDRASLKINKKNDKLIFYIIAKDSVALRSMLNSITKMFTVYEKLNNFMDDKNE